MCLANLLQALELQEYQSLKFGSSFCVCVIAKEKLIKKKRMQYNMREQTDFKTALKKKEKFY